uniref:Uncharacterized protein n=1 Tax=Vibrio lentus TaxID=136468 RepID=A0AB36XIP0_9VIBR|nr:hypothetical protein BCT99_04940 [Vibrio lentus]
MSGLIHLEMSSFMAYRLKRIYRNADNHECSGIVDLATTDKYNSQITPTLIGWDGPDTPPAETLSAAALAGHKASI